MSDEQKIMNEQELQRPSEPEQAQPEPERGSGGTNSGGYHGAQLQNSTEQAATNTGRRIGRQAKNLANKAAAPVKQAARKAADAAKNAVKNAVKKVARMAAKAVAKLAAKAAAAVAKLVAKLSLKAVIAIIAAAWPILLAILIIALIVFAVVFFVIEQQKAGAYAFYGHTVSTYCKMDENYNKRGYTSPAGITKDEFEGDQTISPLVNWLADKRPGLVGDNGVIMTGKIPETKGMTDEEKKKLKKDNKERIANFNDFSTKEERKRLITYLQADRDSILKSPQPETAGEKFGGIFQKIFNKLFHNWTNFYNDEKILETVYGEKIEKPRLKFWNHELSKKDYDFLLTDYEANRLLTRAEDSSFPNTSFIINGKYANVYQMIVQIFYMNSYIKHINEWILSHEDNIKNLKDDTKLTHTTHSDDDSFSEKYEISKMGIEADAMYKELEPHCLQWELLYLIDKAIDEDEFEDMGDLKKENPDEEKIKAEMLEKFIKIGVPKFMPQFRIVRHLGYNEDYTYHHTTPPTNSKDGKSHTSVEQTQNYFPVYKLEYSNDWNQVQWIPYADIQEFYETETYTESPNGSTSKTISRDPESNRIYQEPYDSSMYAGQIFESGSSYEPGGYGGSYTKTKYFKKVIRLPDLTDKPPLPKGETTPGTYSKKDNLKKLFKELYDINKMDIEHALYLSAGAPEFARARSELADIFDIKLTDWGLMGVGAYQADITYLLEEYGDSKIVQFLKENIDYMNQVMPAAGIPVSAFIAQMIQESGPDGREPPGSFNYGNIKAFPNANTPIVGPAGYVLHADGCYYKKYNNYKEFIDDYIKLVQNYKKPIEYAALEGPAGYFRGLKECGYAEDSDYVKKCMNVLESYKLLPKEVQAINGIIPYLQGDSRWNNYPIAGTRWSNTIGSKGCAVTSTAMIATYYNKTTPVPTPITIADAQSNDDAWCAFTNMINKYAHLKPITKAAWNQQKAIELLKKGTPIMVGQDLSSGGLIREIGTSNHFKVLAGYVEGAGFKVLDPSKTSKGSSYSDSLQEANNYWKYLEMYYGE